MRLTDGVAPGELLPELKLGWLDDPEAARFGADSLEITAGPATDWFIDPAGSSSPIQNAPAYVGSPSGDFLLSARVAAEHASVFDAGALVLFGASDTWAKLCLECSAQREPMVVSVVTCGVSDDCNSFVAAADQVRLRIARIGAAFAFHASSDGVSWRLVRYFALPDPDDLLVGFEAQSPTGAGCRARFTDIRYESRTLADIRSGA